MDSTPSVSVVIPAFNSGHLLQDAVESCVRQSVPVAQIIVVDDGSTDDTPAVCERIGGVVDYVWRANGGVSAARNTGVLAATGDLVAFLDADDRWAPDKIECQIALMNERPEVTWCVTDCHVMTFSGDVQGETDIRDICPLYAAVDAAPDELFDGKLTRVDVGDLRCFVGDIFCELFLGNAFVPSSLVIRRETYREIGGFDESFRLAEETEFFHRLAARYPVGFVSRPLTLYRTGGSGNLTAPTNTPTLITNALRSVTAASQYRQLSEDERTACETGKRRLMTRLPYAHLSLGRGSDARSTAIDALRSGYWGALKPWLSLAGSYLPYGLLRRGHRLMSKLGGRTTRP